jgi:hypothetical protein
LQQADDQADLLRTFRQGADDPVGVSEMMGQDPSYASLTTQL